MIGFSALYAQKIPEKGVPWIDNYTIDQFNSHGKIWEISSAGNGIVYMAGDAGLLEFDGITWNRFKGSKGYTRSLLLAGDSLIYTGSDLDFGIWKKNKYQQFEYTSLYPFRKDPNEENEEFWHVYRVRDNILFISFNNIYIYKNKQLTRIAAPTRFSGCFQDHEKIYLADEKNGVYVFNGLSLKLLFAYPGNLPMQIAGVYEKSGRLTIVTKNRGLFLYDSGDLKPLSNGVSRYLQKDQVFCSTLINNSYYAFGTILNGLYITDLDGNIVQHINKQKGLPNNTVLSMHCAADGWLWLGMDYGISAIHLFNDITYFFDYKGEFGTAYAALLKDGIFYLGTNQGLYKAEWRHLNNNADTKPFTLISGSEGQVWALKDIDGTIYCGHDKGLFAVNGNSCRRIHDEPGVWTFLPYNDDYLLTGNYNGVSVFKKAGNGVVFLKKLDLILGSCNQLIREGNNVLWVNIPNFGLIRFALNNDLFPENRQIFPSSQFAGNALNLLTDDKGIALLTDERRYRFDPQKKRFDLQGENALPGRVTGLLDGIYRPVRIDTNYRFYPIYNGFALGNTSIASQPNHQGCTLLIRKVEAFNNQARQLIAPNASVPYPLNNLSFQFVVPHKNGVAYQYQLQNYSEEWSKWTTGHVLDFLHLEEGDYTLKLRAGMDGAVVCSTEVSFSISPPWYRSGLAYLAYVLLAFLVYFLIREWQNFRLREQKRKLLIKEQNSLQEQAERFKQEALIDKQQQLEHEKSLLKQQVKQKNIELVKQARENRNKNRILHILKEKINEVQRDPAAGKMRWAEIKRLLDMYLETDDKTFEIQIDELHQEMFKKLRAQFPDLSLYDLRLCAYLKIGLNSKEISEMLKVLPSSINVSRSRLRKKLNLQHDEDLYGFLNQIS